MLKLYTDDSPGLRVYVSSYSALLLTTTDTNNCHYPFIVILSSSSSFRSLLLHPYSSSISPPKLFAPSPSKGLKAPPGRHTMCIGDRNSVAMRSCQPVYVTVRDGFLSLIVIFSFWRACQILLALSTIDFKLVRSGWLCCEMFSPTNGV